MPANEEWENLRKLLNTHTAHWMIWEAQPSAEIAAKLKELGVASLVFEPCAHRPESGDFIEVMKNNMEQFKAAYR